MASFNKEYFENGPYFKNCKPNLILVEDMMENTQNNNSDIIKIKISEKNKNPKLNIFDNRQYIVDAYDNDILVTIGIVAYNRLDITKLCIESVLRYTSDINYRLILVYNENEHGTGILDYFQSVDYKNKIIIHITGNLGAPLAYQHIQRYIEGKYYIHLPNDVIVTENWLKNLITCAESDIRIGMVNPVSSNVSNLQQVDLQFNNYEEMQYAASEYNVSDPSKWQERVRLITLGTLFKRECLSAIGDIFDIGFLHDFGDDDVSFRVRRAGYKIILAHDTWVHHAHENTCRKSEDLEQGRRCFAEKYSGIDAWDDTCNFIFNKISSNVTMPSDFENPKVLGVDVKCGTPVLDIKNILREYGIFNSEISSFTNDCKYIMDLKTICTGDVVCDRIEFLYNSFKSFYFDYIVIGKCINEYHFPEKVVRDAYALLKRDGQMFLSLKNTYNVLTLLKMLGHDVCFSEHAVHYDVDDFYNLISNMGIDIQLVNVENLNANDIIIDFSSKIIDFAKPDEADKGEVLNRIIADKYWFKITKKN